MTPYVVFRNQHFRCFPYYSGDKVSYITVGAASLTWREKYSSYGLFKFVKVHLRQNCTNKVITFMF